MYVSMSVSMCVLCQVRALKVRGESHADSRNQPQIIRLDSRWGSLLYHFLGPALMVLKSRHQHTLKNFEDELHLAVSNVQSRFHYLCKDERAHPRQ